MHDRPMGRRNVVVVALALIALLATGAAAQPGNTPPNLPVRGERSAELAAALSLGGTALSIGLIAASDGGDDLAMYGVLGLAVTPSLGHWYAGKWWTHGMTARLAGATATLVGGVMLFACIDSDEDCSVAPAVVLLYGGMGTFVIGGIYDIATAARSAHQHNDRLRARAGASWAITPVVAPDRAGVALSGRF